MVDRYPKRIVCLTEETTETLYLLGAQDRIVGISGFTRRPPEARASKPLVSAFTSADFPKIEALAPDLVLAFSDLQADLVRELIARGYDVMTWNQRSVSEILDMIIRLGGLVGKTSEANTLVERLERNLDRVREQAARLRHRPRVYFEEWPDPIIAGIAWVSELIEIAGGDDIFPELRAQPLARGRIVSAAEIATRDPELILASWCGKMVKPERIRARPEFAQLTAAQEGRIREIASTIILQPGPASLTDGLDALHRHIAEFAR
ncbi:MAG TPA: cobalamin-binding protein [Polyangiales bacterium]|nr:cobalamin-binding protein [Polyangiales bacterium]